MKTTTLATVLAATIAGASAGAIGSQIATPAPADATSDAALLRRIDQHIGSGDSAAGSGLWKQVWRSRVEQAEFCRAVAVDPTQCPDPSN